jgi:hypothetical protein
VVKDVLIKLYGQPDANQRFYHSSRELLEGKTIEEMSEEELPF